MEWCWLESLLRLCSLEEEWCESLLTPWDSLGAGLDFLEADEASGSLEELWCEDGFDLCDLLPSFEEWWELLDEECFDEDDSFLCDPLEDSFKDW